MASETTRPLVQHDLDTAEGRVAHIKAAFKNSDPRAIAKAIGDVILEIGVKEFAAQTGLSRSAIYKAFIRDGGNPTLTTLFRALELIGVDFREDFD
ncbi:transcriptional regulator [Bosea sp. UNC402CLCol]|uniref:helix-turn-helix domain-containing transcriptional regulator n=1 Tax=Bosea sp. UNC402CLCol TaxID=1510531 RepID=UPI00057046CD|nr:transcriptional regulator [Bosea sp. UNC402CLCol]